METLALEAWVQMGVAPSSALDALHRAPPVDPAAVAEREEVTNHDLAAFVDVLSSSMTEGGPWVHHGLTSSDVLDTAGAVQLRTAVPSSWARLSVSSRWSEDGRSRTARA